MRNAAERLGFRPNDLAQSLLRGRSFTVGLISTDRYGRFSIPVLEGIERRPRSRARLSVFLCNAPTTRSASASTSSPLLAKRVDGIIVTGRRTDPRPPVKLGACAVPVLYAFAQVADPQALCLLPDDSRRRPARRRASDRGWDVAGSPTSPGPSTSRRCASAAQGFRTRSQRAGLRGRAGHVLSGPWSEALGREAARHLPAGVRRSTRSSAAATRSRAASWTRCARLGVRVPDDIAVVGFDNWEIIAAATRPPLTTIDMNLHELGRQAGLAPARHDRRQRAPPASTALPCRLVVRQSCGAATGAAANVLQEHHDGAYAA